MEELPGGRRVAEADQVTRFTSETIAARQARVIGWVFIALGIGCILFGGIFFAAKHSGHNIEFDQPDAAVGAIVQMVEQLRGQ